jgi:hypothetical protein
VTGGDRVLIDFGVNQFHGSAKYLIDSFEVFAPFHRVVLIEPRAHRVKVQKYYMAQYNITRIDGYVRTSIGDPAVVDGITHYDALRIIADHCRPIDHCVVKYDVDRLGTADTLEWGFLYSLFSSAQALPLVDELYTELHFHYEDIGWQRFDLHSKQQAIDVMRELRRCGLPVHAWP